MAMLSPIHAYPVYEQLPEGCFAHIVANDDNDAVFPVGQIVIVDPSQTEAELNRHYLIEWQSSGRQTIIETFQLGPLDGIAVGGLRRRPFLTAVVASTKPEVEIPRRWTDGRYYPEALAERLKGRIIGVLEPEFDEALLRRIGEARRSIATSQKRLATALQDESTKWIEL